MGRDKNTAIVLRVLLLEAIGIDEYTDALHTPIPGVQFLPRNHSGENKPLPPNERFGPHKSLLSIPG